MKYIVWLTAALGDVVIVTAASYLVWLMPTNIFVWIAVAVTFWVWHGQGGFIAWKPSEVKQYFKNADKIGL